jgi:VRR-NUC domain
VEEGAVVMARSNPEFRIHSAIVQYLRWNAWPEILFFHVPNGNKLAKRTAYHNKQLGVLAGVPDLCFDIAGRSHYIEVKAPGGRLSPDQKAFQKLCLETQRPHAVVYSFDEAIAVLSRWGVLKNARVAA